MPDLGGQGETPQTSVLHAAYDQLAKHGPATDARSVTLTGIARAVGMSRTNLYRRWETSSDLALDIAVHRCTPPDGWHAQVCVDDGGPIAEAIRRALSSAGSGAGVTTRASVATWSDTTAHRRVAAWERAHLLELVERLRREWAGRGDAPWTDVAITITSLLEGMHHIHAQTAEHPGDSMPPELVDELAATAERMIGFFITEVEGDDVALPPEPVGAVDRIDPDEPLPERIVAALGDGSMDFLTDEARRVVDMGVLARTVGVSERSLYARWPTPADLNADLYLESVDRIRDAFARVVIEVFQASVSGTYTNTMPLIARMNDWFMDPDRFPEATVHLGLADVLTGQAVLDRVRGPVELGMQFADLQTAGIVHATGFRVRSDLRMRTYTQLILGMGLGTHRVAALHPAIRSRRLRYLGEEYSAGGVGHTSMTRTSCDLVQPEAPDPASVPPTPETIRPVPPTD